MKKVIFKLGELFCGPGGLALGALKSKVKKRGVLYKIEHAWATDYHQASCNTYIKNLCPNNPETVICKDVRDLNLARLRNIDAFAYGFPCNDFSVVGEKRGFDGEFGPLYTYGIEILNMFRPKFFLAENVGGIASSNHGIAFQQILYDLKNAGNGYTLTVHYYHAEKYGIPQMRHRIIIVGIDKTASLSFKVPKPTHTGNFKTAKEAIKSDLFLSFSLNPQNISLSQQKITLIFLYIMFNNPFFFIVCSSSLFKNLSRTSISQ